MPAIVNWLLRLVLTNPICMRLVQGGSRRRRHLYIRTGYLGLMIGVLLFALLPMAGNTTVRALASSAAQMFTGISYLQVGLICLLTPVFMAGAIAQEANPRTWDILLTTPLGNLQIVLGNLFGRLFFILALLFSTLPLFAVTQYFGGVPSDAIFGSYAIAGSSSLLVAAIAITLCVNRTAGRRAVFWFYVSVIMYLFCTYAIDSGMLRGKAPVAPGAREYYTSVLTPLNPFLALEALVQSNTYVTHNLTASEADWLTRIWLNRPVSTFCWLCIGISVVLILFSTTRVRVIGSRVGAVPWYRRMFGLSARGAVERPARLVGHNPIAWRESVARGKTLTAILARWSFVAAGIAVGLTLIVLHFAGIWTLADLQLGAVTVLAAEIVVIALVALNTSATAVSREREDGTLDLILTTPIQPGPYLAGKLKGLIQFLVPLMLVPFATMLMLSVYVLMDGFGKGTTLTNVTLPNSTATIPELPVILPEGAVILPIVLAPFVAMCVMIGLHWSIRSKGTIGSVIAAVLVVLAVAGVLGLCGVPAGREFPMIGAAFSALSPVNLLWAIVYASNAIPKSLLQDPASARVALVVGALIAAGCYGAGVYGMFSTTKRTFMMTVRRLAGVN